MIVTIIRKALRHHLNEVEDHDPPGGAKGVVEEINNKHSHLVMQSMTAMKNENMNNNNNKKYTYLSPCMV